MLVESMDDDMVPLCWPVLDNRDTSMVLCFTLTSV